MVNKANHPRIILAVVLLCLLPPIGFAAGSIGLATAADSPLPDLIPYAGAVNDLAGKSLAYWFLALAAIAIASWTWLFKWVLNQLESQRAAHGAVTQQLIDYMKTDHADTRTVIAQIGAVLPRIMERLDRDSSK